MRKRQAIAPKPPPGKVPMGSILAAYIERPRARIRPKTRETQRSAARQLAAWDGLDPGTITKRDMERCWRLLARTRAPAHVLFIFALLSASCRWAAAHRLIEPPTTLFEFVAEKRRLHRVGRLAD